MKERTFEGYEIKDKTMWKIVIGLIISKLMFWFKKGEK